MRIYKFIILFALFSLFSCQQIVDNYWERKAEENYSSPYKGVYIGTYSGSDQGTLRIEISAKDFVEVKRMSTLNAVNETFEGGMIGASFNQVKSRTSGFTILGNVISSPQNTYSGTWKIDEGNSGTWILKKQ
ncbi:hypothetical protein [Kaistella carnis]|uniref:Lipoprotein n=2 Tax=Kaistella carnis TaxID=1241979 RepID=A0A3G8XWT4_9FLAO|nr:hypothetical protein [Kaistella carnis]AZI33171.1 hypothetical protein EIB73_08285 [Kaistella carnis]